MSTALPRSGSPGPLQRSHALIYAAVVSTLCLAACGRSGVVEAKDPGVSPVLHLFNGEPWLDEALDSRESMAPLFADADVWLSRFRVNAKAWQPDPLNEGYERLRLRIPAADGRWVHPFKKRIERKSWKPVAEDSSLPEPGECWIDGIYLRRRAGEALPQPFTIDYPTPAGAIAEQLGLAAPEEASGLVELTLGHETRRVRTLRFPESMVYQLELPPRAHLKLGAVVRRPRLSLADGEVRYGGLPKDAEASLRIVLDEESGASTTVWERVVENSDFETYLDTDLDLERWSGETVRLRFECTLSAKSQPQDWEAFAAWSEPVLWSAEPSTTPNLLVLQLDTLRADRIGSYGYPRARTPVLDELATRGVRFADAMSAASWTLPSHASMFTSTYPSQHGLWKDQRLPSKTVTVAEVLRAGGYRTGAFAERGFLNPSHGFARGFDRFNSVVRDCRVTLGLAEDWMKEDGAPFFAFIQTYKVHAPYKPSPEFAEGFVTPYPAKNAYGVLSEYLAQPGEIPLPEEALLTHLSELYDAEIAELDFVLGEFFERLEQAGLLENTLLVVTSDHGEEFYDHGGIAHGGSLYQEQLHVPLILFRKGHFEGGLVVEHPVHGVDLAPTLVEAAGLTAPPSWVGLPLSVDPVDAQVRPMFAPMLTRWTAIEERLGEPATALRLGDLKYIDYPDGLRRHDEQVGPRLYDLQQDPHEERNLLDAEQQALWAERVAEARRRFPRIGEATSTRTNAEVREELEKLGYAGGD